MQHFLVVANQTAGGKALTKKIQDLIAEDPDRRFHLVVPATAPEGEGMHTEGSAQALAKKRLDQALTDLRSLGATIDGSVGDHRPIDAVRDALLTADFDAIIVSTLPSGPSKWLKMDLTSRLSKTFDLPVIHVEAESELASAPPSVG